MTERSNLRGLRILSLAIALILWFFIGLKHQATQPVEKVFTANLTYPSLENMVVLNTVDEVKIRLEAKPEELRLINPFNIDVYVPLVRETGIQEIQLTKNHVQLVGDVTVLSIEPAILHLEIEKVVQRLIRVRPKIVGEPAAGAVALPAVADPSRILIRGPQREVDLLEYVETAPIPLDGHALSFEEIVLVEEFKSPNLQIAGDRRVRVAIPMEQPEIPNR